MAHHSMRGEQHCSFCRRSRTPGSRHLEDRSRARRCDLRQPSPRHRDVLTGDLTVKDVTRPVTLEVGYLGHVRDPWENDRVSFTASARINREDWGMTWNMLLGAGRLIVSKEIDLQIDVELIKQ